MAKNEDVENQWFVVLCNAVGCPIDSKTITIEPKHVAMSKTHIIIASDDVVYYWHYRQKNSTVMALQVGGKSKAGKENAFHIDENPKTDGVYDKSSWKKPDLTCEDNISAIAASTDAFLIGRVSGQVLKFTIPYIQLENRMNLRSRP